MDISSIRKVSWAEIGKTIKAVNPDFAAVVDELSPDKDLNLYYARYNFGSEILLKGRLMVPDAQGELVGIDSPDIDPKMREDLDYNPGNSPMMMLLNNSTEVFMRAGDYIVPIFGMLPLGKLFSTWRVLSAADTEFEPKYLWNMTAGARSMFMLPKISEATGYRRLRREFDVYQDKPKSLLHHWEIFNRIANHPNFGETWQVEVVFFSKAWVEKLQDPAWLKLKAYLLNYAWSANAFWRNLFTWDLTFSLIQKQRDLKPDPYIADTVKHLLAIGVGSVTGFAPTLDDSAGPIKRLQEVFLDCYQLQSYLPLMMAPYRLRPGVADRPTYYSLQYPTTIEFSPRSRESSSAITDLYAIHSLMTRYIEDIHSNEWEFIPGCLQKLAQNTDFAFFHSDESNYAHVRHSSEIPGEDKSFKLNTPNNQEFPANSSFVRGCIRISEKR